MEKKINVSRFTDTKILRFTVEFVTPCFLGGADGNAELRVAPFKNLLRRWWRIANGKLSIKRTFRYLQEQINFKPYERNWCNPCCDL